MDEEDYLEYFKFSEMFGTADNIYPVIYAVKLNTINDFIFATVKEAILVGASYIDDELTQEVVYLDEQIETDPEFDFPCNSFPSSMTFYKYEDARSFTREANKGLIEEYKKTHFDYEVEEVKKAIKKAYAEERNTVNKEINKELDNPHLFSTVYVKTKYPN